MAIRSVFQLFPYIILFFSQYVSAWETSCPAVLNIRPSTVIFESSVPSPWQISPRYMSRLWLSGVGVTQGKPEKLMDLKPETEKIKGENWSVWDAEILSDNETERYWVSCVYGHAQVWLSQPIPASSTRCKTRDFEGFPEEQSISFICD